MMSLIATQPLVSSPLEVKIHLVICIGSPIGEIWQDINLLTSFLTLLFNLNQVSYLSVEERLNYAL